MKTIELLQAEIKELQAEKIIMESNLNIFVYDLKRVNNDLNLLQVEIKTLKEKLQINR